MTAKSKLKLNHYDIHGLVLCFLTLAMTIILPHLTSASGLLTLLVVSSATLLVYGAFLTKREGDASLILLYPVILSAFQNVFIGMVSPDLDQFNTQVLLSINYFVTIEITALLVILNKKSGITKWFLAILLIIIGYSIVLLPFNVPTLASYIACFRNITSPMVFFIFGYCFRTKVNKNRFLKMCLVVFVIVIAFGIFELYFYSDFWINNHIDSLWENKGFSVEVWGLPANFYSSEKIGGSQIRRMVSTFADPVNLGTFLFCGFMIAWYCKKKFLTILILIACILTVSKGALLGLIIFVLVYSFFIPKTKFLFIASIIGGAAVSIAFLAYSSANSTGSTFAHISGLLSSFAGIFENPIGFGIGNVGVLATYLGQNMNSAVIETGLGAVVSQLGLIGLIVYLIVFARFTKLGYTRKRNRERVLIITLVFAIFVNILFNEVALSPNSSALYFIIIGLFTYGRSKNVKYLYLV